VNSFADEPIPARLPEPSEPRGRLGAAVSWLLIAAAVAYMAAGRRLQDRVEKRIAERSTTRPAGEPALPSFQLRLAGRYAVGAHNLFDRGGRTAPAPATSPTTVPATKPTTRPSTAPATAPATGPATGPATSPASTQSTSAARMETSLLDSVNKAAKSPEDRLRAAIVAGEIAGPEAALSQLDETFDSPATRDDAEALRALYRGDDGPLEPARREGLVRRHEWFGELAVAYGKPAGDSQRREVIRPARRTVLAALCAAGAAGLGLLTGVVLLIVALVDRLGGRLRFAYQRAQREESTVPFLEAFAAYLAGMVVVSTAVGLIAGRSRGASWFVIAVIPCAFFWPLLRGVRGGVLRRGLGWTAPRGVFREIGAGIVGYLAGLPLLAAGAVVSFFLQRLSGADTTHPLMNEIGHGGAWRAAQLFLIAAVWAPVVEETMFRGAFYHHLRRRLPWPVAAAFVALVFAAIHPQGWAAIPTLGAIGFSFAAMREWRGSIVAPMVAHALNNGMVTLLLLMMVG